jgi:hypothetical protein
VIYQFSVAFDRHVKDLDFSLNGINGSLKPIDGFNTAEIITIEPSLDGVTARVFSARKRRFLHT